MRSRKYFSWLERTQQKTEHETNSTTERQQSAGHDETFDIKTNQQTGRVSPLRREALSAYTVIIVVIHMNNRTNRSFRCLSF